MQIDRGKKNAEIKGGEDGIRYLPVPGHILMTIKHTTESGRGHAGDANKRHLIPSSAKRAARDAYGELIIIIPKEKLTVKIAGIKLRRPNEARLKSCRK